MYRVRLTWNDAHSQIGAFEVFGNAVDLANSRANEGYKVFDENGTVVYNPLDGNNGDIPQITVSNGKKVVRGISVISPDHMVSFVRRNNPNAQDLEEIANAFVEVGNLYRIRGDIAFCQSIIETGWFRFDKGTAVTPDQHNYSGLGVTSRGLRGAMFATVREGVTAQIQHLFAYATTDEIPEGEVIVDPRFHLVNRGSAPYWEDLSMRWAMNENYGEHILSVYEDLLQFAEANPTEESNDTEDLQVPIEEPIGTPSEHVEQPNENPQETVQQPPEPIESVEQQPINQPPKESVEQESINQPIDDSEKSVPSSPPSFFQRMIRAFVNFFRNLFS